MSEPKSADEPSMEEILSSIRRIIADDDEENGHAPRGERHDDALADSENEPGAADDLDDEDVLDLGMVSEEDETDEDGFASLDEDLGNDAVEPGNETADLEFAETDDFFDEQEETSRDDTIASEHVLTDEVDVNEESRAPVQSLETGIVSGAVAAAATGAFAKLNRALTPENEMTMSEGQGLTIEQMVSEMMRPMLKEWLDNNLPSMVEKIVEREIRKLVRQAELDD
ncbi:MAG: DUF2497 domain-containing protein [Geminicoccaceae bacterium]